jgi:hypothetical protein
MMAEKEKMENGKWKMRESMEPKGGCKKAQKDGSFRGP